MSVFPKGVVIQDIPGSGRGLIATEKIQAGVKIFEASAYGAFLPQRTRWCHSCYRHGIEALPYSCECEAHWCSEQCQIRDHKEGHQMQCEARQKILKIASRKLDDEDKAMALFLLSVLTKKIDDCSTVASNDDLEHNSEWCSLPDPSFEELMIQIPDSPEIANFDKREVARNKICHAVRMCGKVGKVDIMSILRTINLNVFNLKDARQNSCGWIMYPQASLMNHSCFPNTGCNMVGKWLQFSALRDIEVGEELTQCYLRIGVNQDCKSWGFSCRCPRCTDEVDAVELASFDERFICHCGCIVPTPNKSQCNCYTSNCIDPEQITI